MIDSEWVNDVNLQDTPGASALDALRLASGARGDASAAPPADPFTAAAKSSFDAPWYVLSHFSYCWHKRLRRIFLAALPLRRVLQATRSRMFEIDLQR